MLISLKTVKGFLIAFLLYTFFLKPLINQSTEKVPLEGVYATEIFVLNNDTLPLNPMNSARWNKMYIDRDDGINVVTNENQNSFYYSRIDSLQKTIALYQNHYSTNFFAIFTYLLKKDTLFLDGFIQSDSVKIIFSRKTKKGYPLLNRNFHWINEYPYNR